MTDNETALSVNEVLLSVTLSGYSPEPKSFIYACIFPLICVTFSSSFYSKLNKTPCGFYGNMFSV